MIFYLVITIGLLTLFISKIFERKSNEKLPKKVPGAVPLFGHLLYIGSYPSKTFLRWKKQYGPMYMVQLGSFRTLVINDSKILKEANKVAFAGRPPLNTFATVSKNKGLIMNDYLGGEQRNFVVKQMKIFSESGAHVEAILNEGLATLLDSFAARAGNPVQMKDVFTSVFLNSVWETTMGFKYASDDPELHKLASMLLLITAQPTLMHSIGNFMPWLSKLLPGMTGVTAFVNSYTSLMKFVDDKIEMRKRSRVQRQPRDLLDAYLDCVDETTNPDSTFYVSKNFVSHTMTDMLMASFETSSTLSEWIVHLITRFPHVQKKVQNEISSVIGDSVLPRTEHRTNMHYTEAVIAEIFRFVSVVPMGIPHYCTADTNLCGLFIPKDTLVFSNLYAIHHDPEIWGDPEEFRPERFLNADGKFIKNENVVTFGFGRRICLGESYARDQMFLLVVRIFQKFNVSFADKIPSLEGKFGITVHMEPFKLIFTERL